jgi:drug/metabolite transporter (DMT)-like permease
MVATRPFCRNGYPRRIAGIVLALAASLLWGTADYLGGSASRRLPLVGVALVTQAVGLAAILVVAAVVEGDHPSAETVLAGGAAGVLGAIALLSFYRALAIGTMSVVAPICSASALVPVLVGLARGDRPGALTGFGMLLAIVGVVLASREPSGGERRRNASVPLAITAAVALGLQLVMLDRAGADGAPLWGVTAARTVSVAIFSVAALVVAARVPVRRVPSLAGIGVVDTSANAAFALAATRGPLSIVAVLGSLFPLVTVAFAHVRLGERLTPVQATGASLAVIGTVIVSATTV